MSTPLTHSRLRVAICGGGLGGLTLACALSKIKDITVDVYEATAEFSEIGAGISVRPRTLRFLNELGLYEDLVAISGKATEEDIAGPVVAPFLAGKPHAEAVGKDFVKGTVMLHRAQFHNVLFKHIPAHVCMHTSKRLVSYLDPEDANRPITLVFADGTEATCDVLVGADGVKSAVRASMYEALATRAETQAQADELRNHIPPRFSGAIAYRGVVPKEKLIQDIPAESTIWRTGKLFPGGSMYLLTYPIAQGSLLNVVILVRDMSREGSIHPQPWVETASLEHLSQYLSKAAPQPRLIMAALEGIEMRKWVICAVPPLPDWTSGRAILFGDAAHAMTPDQGAGAAQAVEDAQVLSTLLAHPRLTRDTLKKALRAHTDVRKPIATAFWYAARTNGLTMSNADMTPQEVADGMHNEAQTVWGNGTPEGNAERAVELFEVAIAAA